MQNFQFGVPTTVQFGRGCVSGIAEAMKGFEVAKWLIVTDETLLSLGIVEQVLKGIDESAYVIYPKVRPNPETGNIRDGVAACKAAACTGVLAIGGGSAMDTAKGIAYMVNQSGEVEEYLDGRGSEKRALDGEILPILAVTTTAGTGSEVSLYAVITDEKTRIKDSLSEGGIYPKVAWIDPNLMDGLPARVTAFTGMDALGHALEAILSTVENPMADFYAIEAMKRIFVNLPKAVAGERQARDEMAFSAMLAGAAMSHCGAALPHGLGCPLSGHLDLPHGLTVGILQIPMLKVSKPAIAEKAAWINQELKIEGEDAVDALIGAIATLEDTIGFPKKLETDFDESTLSAMVADAMIHGCTGLNPKPLTKEDVEAIYRAL